MDNDHQEPDSTGPAPASQFCAHHSWEALRPWMAARLGQDDLDPQQVADWLTSAPAHNQHAAALALRAMACGPWSVQHVASDGRLTLRLHCTGPQRHWRLVLNPADPFVALRVTAL